MTEMTAIEIEKALADIVVIRADECKKKIAELDGGSYLEKKALKIEEGMYNLCLHAGLIYNNVGERERALATKSKRMNWLGERFSEVNEMFLSADDEEKLRITAAFHGEMCMEDQFLRNYRTELKMAENSGDADAVFEMKLKVSVVESIMSAWYAWRCENGIYPDVKVGENT